MHNDKHTYRSLAKAQAAAKEVRDEEPLRSDTMQGYKCKFGNHYHYGHTRESGKLRKEMEAELNDRKKQHRTGNTKNAWGYRRDTHRPG